ncbi:MAG: GTP pyrophosphokinase family protein, partial [Clostridia bacterium]|nr:GTP pyrophosphokinase family protein [Clostridia bacterium]
MEENNLKNQDIEKIESAFGEFKKFRQFMMMYNCAIKEVQTKFEILNDELSTMHNRNPIEIIKSRIKTPESIIEKLYRKDFPLSMESVLENINDVAGIRVICSFVDDIYQVAQMLVNQDDVKLVEVKDYIKNPKDNGYRSYHMIIEVPVFFTNRKQYMRVEVQLRTIAMDFWASLEHK